MFKEFQNDLMLYGTNTVFSKEFDVENHDVISKLKDERVENLEIGAVKIAYTTPC